MSVRVLLLSLLLVSCDDVAAPVEDAGVAVRSTGGTVCDSSVHETSAVDPAAQFDLECALDLLAEAGCDFTLDPDGDGTALPSSTLEDLFDDPATCQSGIRCSGCSDGQTVHTIGTCEELAGVSYFAASAWHDLAAACPPPQPSEPVGCTIEGVAFDADEAECARRYFETVTCPPCAAYFDPRTCEDAINDPAQCQVGSSCTGCNDGDGRGNGVTCEEIADYAYFGPASADLLRRIVRAHPCDRTCTPSCDARTCGDDGCGGTCGTCAAGSSCGTSGACETSSCTIEGVFFDATQIDCALALFETMDCQTCAALFDSRTCEDAINDPALCQLGPTCDGCDDEDGRDDGVTCAEIEGYLYFGRAAAQKLYDTVQTDPSCGAPGLVIEGVPLTMAQADAIVRVANEATLAQLDDDAALDARAAANLVDARPFTTIDQVAAVSRIGPVAIERLRDYAATL